MTVNDAPSYDDVSDSVRPRPMVPFPFLAIASECRFWVLSLEICDEESADEKDLSEIECDPLSPRSGPSCPALGDFLDKPR